MWWLEQVVSLTRRLVVGRRHGERALRSGLRSATVRDTLVSLYRGVPGPRLDVGCGGGDLFADMLAHGGGGELVGVDRDAHALAEARDHWGWNGHTNGAPQLVQADAQALPFRHASFRLVTCVNTLLIFPAAGLLRQAVSEMARVCQRGGTIAFDIRNRRHPVIWASYPLVRHLDPTCQVDRLRAYTPGEIVQLLDGLPVRVVRVVKVGRRAWWPSVFIVECRRC